MSVVSVKNKCIKCRKIFFFSGKNVNMSNMIKKKRIKSNTVFIYWYLYYFDDTGKVIFSLLFPPDFRFYR